jgi:hypothetical protein
MGHGVSLMRDLRQAELDVLDEKRKEEEYAKRMNGIEVPIGRSLSKQMLDECCIYIESTIRGCVSNDLPEQERRDYLYVFFNPKHCMHDSSFPHAEMFQARVNLKKLKKHFLRRNRKFKEAYDDNDYYKFKYCVFMANGILDFRFAVLKEKSKRGCAFWRLMLM